MNDLIHGFTAMSRHQMIARNISDGVAGVQQALDPSLACMVPYLLASLLRFSGAHQARQVIFCAERAYRSSCDGDLK